MEPVGLQVTLVPLGVELVGGDPLVQADVAGLRPPESDLQGAVRTGGRGGGDEWWGVVGAKDVGGRAWGRATVPASSAAVRRE